MLKPLNIPDGLALPVRRSAVLMDKSLLPVKRLFELCVLCPVPAVSPDFLNANLDMLKKE
jgi:hypothetical protein